MLHDGFIPQDSTFPAGPSVLAESDVRAIVRLLGSVASLEAPPIERKHVLMSSLADLIGAKAWLWGLGVQLKPDALPKWMLELYGGLDESAMATYLRAQEHPDMTRLTAPFIELLMSTGSHLTRLRQQTDPDDTFRTSPAYSLWVEAGVMPGILSCRPIDDRTVSVISLHRAPEAPLFSERESRIAHIVLTEIPWLYQPDTAVSKSSNSISHLSPRCHTVFNLLVLGQNRQQIADNLKISIHTLNDYVKTVFRHFGVNSQLDLMRRFSQGNGGDAS
jgi:DNA-binding CsgD family transcriptional regulator